MKRSGKAVSCLLCQRSAETPKTGPLSSKDGVTAHQNCLLYSSGICCQCSPQFDDLFGFSITDVLDEVKRGSKLYCYRCKKKGATAGCEVRRCNKSYHYPCAVEDGAQIIEDENKGEYGLYCSKHTHRTEGDNKSVRESVSSREPKILNKSCEAGPSQVKYGTDKGNTTLEIVRCDKSMLTKHKPSSWTESVGNRDSVAGLSSSNSDANTSGSMKHVVKRRLSYNGIQEPTPSKQKRGDWVKRLGDSDSDQLASENGCNDKDEDHHSMSSDESESLLHQEMHEGRQISQTSQSPEQHPRSSPVSANSVKVRKVEVDSVQVHAAGPSGPQQSEPASYPDYCEPLDFSSSPPCSSAISPPIPEKACMPQHSAPSPPSSPPVVSEVHLDSTTFWKVCNEAKCTQVIFNEFICDMTRVSHRIQSDQASQEDYNLAFKVMMASGKLAALVTKQQRELEKTEAEVRNAAAAMKKIMLALRK